MFFAYLVVLYMSSCYDKVRVVYAILWYVIKGLKFFVLVIICNQNASEFSDQKSPEVEIFSRNKV